MFAKNMSYTLETTIKEVYEVDDDIIGIVCDPNPNTLDNIYFEQYESPGFVSGHKQNDDLYLKKDHIHLNVFSNILKPGVTLRIKYNQILCKNFNDDFKTESDKLFSISNFYNNCKLKIKNNKKRVYSNYVADIENCPTYRDIIKVSNISYYNDKYCEIDTTVYYDERLLVSVDDVSFFHIGEKYKIYFKKSNEGLNYYMITDMRDV